MGSIQILFFVRSIHFAHGLGEDPRLTRSKYIIHACIVYFWILSKCSGINPRTLSKRMTDLLDTIVIRRRSVRVRSFVRNSSRRWQGIPKTSKESHGRPQGPTVLRTSICASLSPKGFSGDLQVGWHCMVNSKKRCFRSVQHYGAGIQFEKSRTCG